MTKYVILLDSNANIHDSESEEKDKFVKHILDHLNIECDFWSPPDPLSPEQKAELRGLIRRYDLSIVENDPDAGAVRVYFENKPLGEWKRPEYKLKMDHKAIDPKKKKYIEMTVTFSSVFDESP